MIMQMVLVGLALAMQANNELVRISQRVLAAKPAACVQEKAAGQTLFHYTFLNESGKAIFTYDLPDVVDFKINAAGDTIMVVQLGDYNKGTFGRTTMSLVNSRGKIQPDESMPGWRFSWSGNTIYAQNDKAVEKFVREEGASIWTRSTVFEGPVNWFTANEDGSQSWAGVPSDNKEEARDKLVRVLPEGRKEAPVTLGYKYHGMPTVLPGSDWLAFLTEPRQIAFVNPKTNAKFTFEQTQTSVFVWLPGPGALAYMAAMPDDHVDRYQFGLFYGSSGKSSVCQLPGKFILEYVGFGPDRLLVLTMDREGLTKDLEILGGGAQRGTQLPAAYFDPEPRSLLIVDPVSGKVEKLATMSDKTHPVLRSCWAGW